MPDVIGENFQIPAKIIYLNDLGLNNKDLAELSLKIKAIDNSFSINGDTITSSNPNISEINLLGERYEGSLLGIIIKKNGNKKPENIYFSDSKTFKKKSAYDLVKDIISDGKLDGNDLINAQALSAEFKEVVGDSKNELSGLKESLKESTLAMLENGYTVNNENDYKALKEFFKILESNIKIPDYTDIKSGNKKDELFSITYEEGADKILLYKKESYMKDITINTDEYGYINVSTGEFLQDTNIYEFYKSFDDNIDNNNNISLNNIEELEKKDLINQYKNIIIEGALDLADNSEYKNYDFDSNDIPLTIGDIQEIVNAKLAFQKERKLSNDTYKASVQETPVTIEATPAQVMEALEANNKGKNEQGQSSENQEILSNTNKLQTIIDGLDNDTYNGVTFKIKGGKCYFTYDNGMIERYFTIDLPANNKYLTEKGLKKLADTKVNQLDEKNKKLNQKKPGEDNKSKLKENTEDKSILDTITDGLSDGAEYVVDKSKQLAKYVDEIFDGEKIGKFKGENGKTIEIEYDEKTKTLSIDTSWFDGINDYDIEQCLANIDMSSAEKAKEGIKNHIDMLKSEYDQKIETAEINKLNKNIKDLLQGKRKRKTVDTVIIDGKEMGIILFRDRKDNIKAKLDTPYGDGVSDSDVTIEVASIGDKIGINDIRTKIQDAKLVDKYTTLKTAYDAKKTKKTA